MTSAYAEWVRLTAQQPSTTLHHRHDDRQPDPLITPDRTYPSTSNHTPIPPPFAPIASSTLLELYPPAKPHLLVDTENYTIQTMKPALLSQQNGVDPNPHSPEGEQGREFRHTETKSGIPWCQEEMAKGKEHDTKKALVMPQTITAREERYVIKTANVNTTHSGRQTVAIGKGESKALSLSANKKELVENGLLGQSVGEAEFPRPQSTDPDQLLEELSLSSLSLSHTHPIDLSPTNSTLHSLGTHQDSCNVIPAVSTGQDGDKPTTGGDDLIAEDLSLSSHDGSTVESVPARERAVGPHPPGVGEARRREKGYSMDTKVSKKVEMSSTLAAAVHRPSPTDSPNTAESASSTALAPSPLRNNPSTCAPRPDHCSISTCHPDKDNVSAIQRDEESVSLSPSLSVSSSEHQAAGLAEAKVASPLTASKKHVSQSPNDRGLPSGSLAATTNDRNLLDGQLTPSLTDSMLSESDEDIVSTGGVKAGSPVPARSGGRSTSSAVGSRAAPTAVVTNLFSTLNRHLSVDAESADLMYSLPSSSDGMKGQINGSHVLSANITK